MSIAICWCGESHNDLRPQVRTLVSGHLIPVQETFTGAELRLLATAAEQDPRTPAEAQAKSEQGHVTQYLAGGPAQIERYCTADPAAQAVLHAAMDARRLGGGLHIARTVPNRRGPGIPDRIAAGQPVRPLVRPSGRRFAAVVPWCSRAAIASQDASEKCLGGQLSAGRLSRAIRQGELDHSSARRTGSGSPHCAKEVGTLAHGCPCPSRLRPRSDRYFSSASPSCRNPR